MTTNVIHNHYYCSHTPVLAVDVEPFKAEVSKLQDEVSDLNCAPGSV